MSTTIATKKSSAESAWERLEANTKKGHQLARELRLERVQTERSRRRNRLFRVWERLRNAMAT